MINRHVRFLVLAAALCVVVGPFHPVSATETVPEFQGLVAESGPEGPVIRLRTEGELDTVYYSPQPGVWVVEMPEATWQEVDNFVTAPDLGIERAELTHVEEFGKALSRLTVWLNEPVRLELTSGGDGIDLQFVGLSTAPSMAQKVPVSGASVEEPYSSDFAIEPAVPSQAGSILPGNAPVEPVQSEQNVVETGAESLFNIEAVVSGEGLVVELRGDGPLKGRTFELPAPDRLVVDFPGIVNRVERNLYSINSGAVRQIRIAQFRGLPEPVTRVVIDLASTVEHRLTMTPQGARLVIGDTLSSDDFHPVVVESESVFVAQLPADTGSITIQRSPGPTAFDNTGAPEVATVVPDEEALPAISEKTIERSPWVADKSQLIEQAPAAEMLNAPNKAADGFVVTEVETQEQQFTGEPITLTLKDADIKDVLRTFSELTQLNIVLDPGVSGSVTVELRDVPWDQALDLILRINNLDYILENNVLRVAPTARLADEKRARANFAKDEEMAQPLKTVLKPVSYARATYIQGLLQGDSYLMSARGTVTVDERTNTLIIRDVVDRVEGVLRLIDSLDMPTPQVVIEGRIVETTRDFSHELGINWGFEGTMDQEHGNDTGLSFPNSIQANGGVTLAQGTHWLGMTFGDILDTFNLDFQLRAAESDGVVTIVSTPRVTTQNLTAASIRSGLQIPVQTVSNNTVTVQYVDATLRLEVTPQITAEGTVNLDLNINKREAILGIAVAGSTNAPIFTREAKTQLLVRDGGTTVIAGIYVINDQESESSVPGLNKIPIIKYLFKNKGVFKRHDELLIFITPRIVKY